MRSPVIRFLMALLLTGSLCAETSQEAGKRLIQECLKAVGGQAFLDMRNRVLRGRAYQFRRDELRALAVITYYIDYEPKPTSPDPGWIGVRERRDIGKDPDYSILFFDGKGYEITFRGARPYPASEMEEYRRRLRRDVFYILKYRLDEPGMIFESLGTEIVVRQPTDALRITDADNDSVTVYLLKSSRLPLRQQYSRRDPKTREVLHEVFHYSRYRRTAGVRLPWNILHERDGERVFEMFGGSMDINQKLDSSLFSLGGTTVLPEN